MAHVGTKPTYIPMVSFETFYLAFLTDSASNKRRHRSSQKVNTFPYIIDCKIDLLKHAICIAVNYYLNNSLQIPNKSVQAKEFVHILMYYLVTYRFEPTNKVFYVIVKPYNARKIHKIYIN